MEILQLYSEELEAIKIRLDHLMNDEVDYSIPMIPQKIFAARHYCRNVIKLIGMCNELQRTRSKHYIDKYFNLGMEKIKTKLDWEAINIAYSQDIEETGKLIHASGFERIKNVEEARTRKMSQVLSSKFPIDRVREDLKNLTQTNI